MNQTSREGRPLFPGLTRAGVLLAVLLAVTGAATGAALAASSDSGDTAQATVLINPLEGNPFLPTSDGGDLLNLQTESRLVASDAVATLVKKKLDLTETPEQILEGLDVEVRPNTAILDISYTGANEKAAVTRAQAFATVFLQFRKSRAEALIGQHEATIKKQLHKQNTQLANLIDKRDRVGDDNPRAALLDRTIEGVTQQGQDIRTQLAQFNTTAANPGQVVTPATTDQPGLLGSRGFLTVLGLLLGLALAAGLIALRSLLGRRLRDTEQVEYPIATISYDQAADLERQLPSYGETAPQLPSSFENLSIALMARGNRRPACVVLATRSEDVPAPVSGSGLAMAVAMTGQRVVLVDATNLDPEGSTGLNQVLMGLTDLESSLINVGHNLVVLPSGSTEGEESESLLLAPDMALVVERLKEVCDMVLVLAGPVQAPATTALTALADVVLVESDCDGPTRELPHDASVIFVPQQRKGSLASV